MTFTFGTATSSGLKFELIMSVLCNVHSLHTYFIVRFLPSIRTFPSLQDLHYAAAVVSCVSIFCFCCSAFPCSLVFSEVLEHCAFLATVMQTRQQYKG